MADLKPGSDTTASETLPKHIHMIASMLDHPSVFMGGPSHQNRLKAKRIWDALKAEGLVKEPTP